MSEERLEKIESSIAYLDESLQALLVTTYQQQQKIDQLQALCESLIGHVRELAGSIEDYAIGNERPPLLRRLLGRSGRRLAFTAFGTARQIRFYFFGAASSC